MHDRGVSSIEFARSASPIPTPASMATATAAPTVRQRASFSLGLPWRPQSEYSNNSPSGLRPGLTRSQRRFVRSFPELADLVMVPSAYCALCMATPPQSPPASISRSSSTMSPTNTINTLASSDLPSTPSSGSLSSSCPGHFDDFSCALEREILWQGTLYVTATHVCFYGKQFGKAVRVMIDYRDMVSIDKEKKMGLFPSSIRIRARTPSTSNAKGREDPVEADKVSTEEEPSIKDYVLTSLMSREQAYAIMERNWTLHRRVMRTFASTGLETPQAEIAEIEGHATDIFDLNLGARIRSGTLRDQWGGPRTYSVITDESISSCENLDRPTLRVRLSSTRLRPATSAATSNNIDAVESWNVNTDDYAQRKDRMSSTSSDSRRGSTASASSSSDKQEPSSSGLMGFLQRRTSQRRRCGKTGTAADGSSSLEQQEVITQNSPDCDYSFATTSNPIVRKPSLSNSVHESVSDISRSSTPPILISPSLTTTKVSHSSSTVQTVAQPGNTRGVTVHIRKESGETMAEKTPKDDVASATAGAVPTPAATAAVESLAVNAPAPVLVPVVPLPSSPVSCGCQRHYKNTVLSTLIPLPLDLCFEILFSSKGAGLSDKLGCDSHRIKDGSTEIKIMPWQGEEPKTTTEWEAKKRNLEYSVTFKMPMCKFTEIPSSALAFQLKTD
ncbi:hypothetical protein EDD21DRAFT_46163 [Dissophora ornata]|nr:hypothetical protein EDD21DRAFT_46163 [Dissophora ornata]